MVILTNVDLAKNQVINVVIQLLPSPPQNPALGQIYYNTTDNLVYKYDGASKGWNTVGAPTIAWDKVTGKPNTVAGYGITDLKIQGGVVTIGSSTITPVVDESYVHTDNNFTTTEKNKLSSVASGAQVNVIETIRVNGTAMTVTGKAVDLSVPVAATVMKSNAFTASATGVKQTVTKVNTAGGAETTEDITLPVANGNTAGMMTPEQVEAIEELESRVGGLENQNVRLSYTASGSPTAAEIRAFVLAAGYTDSGKWASISVVVSATNHIWRYYSNTQTWTDIGIDTVQQASQSVKGIVQGSSTAGKVFVEADGTMSLNGYDGLVDGISALDDGKANKSTTYTKTEVDSGLSGKQDKALVTSIGSSSDNTHYPSAKAVYDLVSGHSSVAVTTGTIGTSATSVTVSYSGTYIACIIIDSVTREVVLADVTVNTSSVTVETAAAYTHALTVVVVAVSN